MPIGCVNDTGHRKFTNWLLRVAHRVTPTDEHPHRLHAGSRPAQRTLSGSRPPQWSLSKKGLVASAVR
ncbi:MAG: hypothetical protein CMM01_26060 [Rhodopirellula sp.]|nr:hypothetical protein [Rhodopirellula sp.]